MRYFKLAPFFLCCLLFAVSCNESQSGKLECLTSADCQSGQSCVMGKCSDSTVCETDEDCPAKTYCKNASCVSAKSCGSLADCPFGFDCINYICKPIEVDDSCSINDDCAYGYHCDSLSGTCSKNPEGYCTIDEHCDKNHVCVDNECVLKIPEDGDNDVDLIEEEQDKADGDMDEEQETDDNVDTLCLSCEKDRDCNSDMSAFCMEDTSGAKFCGRFCDQDNLCPEGYVCREVQSPDNTMVGQCLPQTGICHDITDGDVDEDMEQEKEPCTGSCNTSVNVDICYGDDLCICDNNQFSMLDCTQWCLDNGYTGFDHCGHDNALNHSRCYCSGTNSGDADYCTGFTGSNECCMEDNPCGYDADDICQCEGFCSWEEDDCGGSSTEGSGTCADPFIVNSFPYTHDHTTEGHESNINGFFCDSEDMSHSSSGPEAVYRIYGTVGLVLSIDVINTSYFDPVIISTADCSDVFADCYAVNYSSSGEDEGAILEFSQTGYATILIDTDLFTGGSYTLMVYEDME